MEKTGKRLLHRHLKGNVSRGESKNIQEGVAVPCRLEHNDWPVIKKYLSGIKLALKNSPWLGLMDFKGQAIGNILTCVTAGAWNFHDFPLKKTAKSQINHKQYTVVSFQVIPQANSWLWTHSPEFSLHM